MIHPNRIRRLDLVAPTSPGRFAHLSAASGLVRVRRLLYVVADDELHLGMFDATGSAPGKLIALFDGKLPESKSKRKAKKPDLEALALLPPFSVYDHGALFALGSGSRRNRRTGALLGLTADGEASGQPSRVDLSSLFALLENEFSELNIEGAVASGDELCLLQRGNSVEAQNAVVRYRLAEVLDVLAFVRDDPLRPLAIQRVDLGNVDGIPLCFTDGAALPNDELLFTAIAENTHDCYRDGPCVGSAVGIIGHDGTLRYLDRLDHPYKIEGVDATVVGNAIRLLLVTDDDDPSVPAFLLAATIAA